MIPRGIDVSSLKVGENRRPCPECNRGDKDTALAVRLCDDGRIVWNCKRCGMAGGSNGGHSLATPQRHHAAPCRNEKARGLSDYARGLWSESQAISGPAKSYLEARCCRIPPADGDLRYMPELKHPSGYLGPALVALITDAETAVPLSLHRTWIDPDGNKAKVTPPRLLLKNHPIGGGVIRLWPDEATSSGLGIAEGIETALSLAHGFTPVWACIDAGHLAKFPVLPGIGELVIAADNDEAGLFAAAECARRWASHATVRTISADTAGFDLNDEVRSWVK